MYYIYVLFYHCVHIHYYNFYHLYIVGYVIIYPNSIHDYNDRTISHAILNGINTTILYKQRRYHCSNCNKSFVEPNPFLNPKTRISKYTVLRIMKELKIPRYTFSMVADNCGVSASTAMHVFDNAVAIPNKKLPAILCIDAIFSVKYKQRVLLVFYLIGILVKFIISYLIGENIV